ncbi:hypothetical protein [Roseobacter sp. HKCCA0434]|nr:hypothetical protein [Roseobacter sp. HKCCA0434]
MTRLLAAFALVLTAAACTGTDRMAFAADDTPANVRTISPAIVSPSHY